MFATRVRRGAAATSLVVAAAFSSACSDSKSTAPDVPAVMSVVRGSGESITVGSTNPDTLVVQLTTLGADPARGVVVTWAVVQGDGTLSSATATTDANGMAQVVYLPGHTAGTDNVTASSQGIDPASFSIVQAADVPHDAATVAGEPTTTVLGSGAVQLQVRILDEFQNPVQGVPVHWSVTGGDGRDSFDLAESATNDEGIAFVQYTPLDVTGNRTVTATTDAGPTVSIGLNVLAATIVGSAR